MKRYNSESNQQLATVKSVKA